jgi:small neutral amino acid transporter SnatA (MarC family)
MPRAHFIFLGERELFFRFLGFAILIWMMIEKFMGESISEKIWPLIGVFLIMIGVQLFIFGLWRIF